MNLDFFFHANDEVSDILNLQGVYLVTGAKGSVGSALVECLVEKFSDSQDFELLLVSRSPVDFNINCNDVKYSKIKYLTWDDLSSVSKVDYIIHLASPTNSSDFYHKPAKTFNDIVYYGRLILDFAVASKPKSILMASSLEVYGVKYEASLVDEVAALTYDFSNSRSSYSCAKMCLESMAKYYSCEYGVSIKIARMSPILSLNNCRCDNRLLASMVCNAINNEDIVLYSDGSTVRSYCYITDCISAFFYLLASDDKFDIYNIANENNVASVNELANMIIDLSGCTSRLVYINDKIKSAIYPPPIRIVQDTTKLRELGWMPKISLRQMLIKYISYNMAI